MACNPDPGEWDTVREPVPGHDQLDLSVNENHVLEQNNQPNADNIKKTLTQLKLKFNRFMIQDH